MRAKWEDKTSYSRDEKPRVPRCWELRVAWLRLIVHRLHGVENVWFGSCYDLNLKDIDLGSDLEQAKSLLVMTIKDKLHTGYTALAKL